MIVFNALFKYSHERKWKADKREISHSSDLFSDWNRDSDVTVMDRTTPGPRPHS